MTDARKPVDRVERLEEELALVRAAQKTYAEFTQEQVDRIFFAAAMAILAIFLVVEGIQTFKKQKALKKA